MSNWELPLVLSTVLVQGAVGIALMLTIAEFAFPQLTANGKESRLRIGGMLVLPLAAIGIVCSIFHMGQPLSALNAFRHLGTSNLSMETLFSAIIGVISAVYFFIWWKKADSVALRKYVGLALAIVGIAAIVVSSRVYMLPARAAWNSWTTTASFLLTALLLGSMAILFLLRGEEAGKARSVFTGTALTAVVLIVLVTAIGGTAATGTEEQTAAALATFTSPLFYVRIGLGLLLSAACVGAALKDSKGKAGALFTIALACALIGELTGRILFYATTLNQAPWF